MDHRMLDLNGQMPPVIREPNSHVQSPHFQLARWIVTKAGRGGPMGIQWFDGPYTRASDSPFEIPKIFIHGLGGNPRTFDQLIDRLLEEGHRNIAVFRHSLHAHPVTPEVSVGEAKSMLCQLEDASSHAQQAGHPQATLIGYSWGAALGLAAASRYPERWHGIVSIAGFVNNLGHNEKRGQSIIRALNALSRVPGMHTIAANVQFAQQASTMSWLEDPKSISCPLTTISCVDDQTLKLPLTTRMDARANYLIDGATHGQIAEHPTVLDRVAQILS
jgi:pimeloyl-ACP methyl ester carboxylesterase